MVHSSVIALDLTVKKECKSVQLKGMASIKSRLLGTIVIIAIVVIVLLSSLPIVFFYVNTNTPEVEVGEL